MEYHGTALKLIVKNNYLATIDFKEAYLSVPIHSSQKKYLPFQFLHDNRNIVTYEFNAMSYGLCSAPQL